MSQEQEPTHRRRVDALSALVVLGVAAAFLVAARLEPKALYDPFGPGTAPMAVAAVLALLALVLLVRSLLGQRVGQSAHSLILQMQGDIDYRLRPDLVAVTFGATMAYVGALTADLPFLWSTVAFLLVLGGAMTDRRPRSLVVAAAVAVIGAVAIDALFRRVLLVILP
jgi:hypothetical protein